MQIISDNEAGLLPDSVATIGFFDGVHVGHLYLIKQVCDLARQRGLASAVITFRNHPRQVLQPDFQPQLLCDFHERMQLLSLTGVDYCVVLDFSKSLSELSAKCFISNVLCDKLHVKTLLVGYDHRFGHNRTEGFAEYQQYGASVGMEVVLVQEYTDMGDAGSSRIRQLLAQGDVAQAARLLTYNYRLRGTVVLGFKVGRTIGYPTANIKPVDSTKLIPANGVYAVRMKFDGDPKVYGGMLYIGNRPTLEGENRTIEVNIFDYSGDLYAHAIEVEFIATVRDEQRFASLEELSAQLGRDKIAVQKILEKL